MNTHSGSIVVLTFSLGVLSSCGSSPEQSPKSVSSGEQAPQSASQPPTQQAARAVEEGLAAAKQQDWKLAIQHFSEAQAADPGATEIWFNLGLASSNVPGNEFRAIAWMKAYLLANPNVQNAPSVRQRVVELQSTYESRLGKVVEALEKVSRSGMDDAIAHMHARSNSASETVWMDAVFSPAEVGGLLAAMHLNLGDLAGAKNALASFGVNPFSECGPPERWLPEHFTLAATMAGIAEKKGCRPAHAAPLNMPGSYSLAQHHSDGDTVPGLLRRAREGESLNVTLENYSLAGDGTNRYQERKFEETQLDDFVQALAKDLREFEESYTADDYGPDGPTTSSARGDRLSVWLSALASLVVSYREMRGPYQT